MIENKVTGRKYVQQAYSNNHQKQYAKDEFSHPIIPLSLIKFLLPFRSKSSIYYITLSPEPQQRAKFAKVIQSCSELHGLPAKAIKNNHENTYELSVKDKSARHEYFHGLFRGFAIS
jgi:hypothetical protein